MWASINNDIRSLSSRGAPRNRTSQTSIPSAIRTLLVRANPLPRLQAWMRHEASLNELYGLDGRTLADLGITRGDFPRILAGSYQRGE